MLLVQKYGDDIIICATNESLGKDSFYTMKSEFELSMMGDLHYFLSLQIYQTKEEIFINQ